MSFLHYQQGDSVWDDPVGYGLNHKSAVTESPQAKQIEGLSSEDADYFQNNILPLQQSLLNKATDPNTVTNAVTQARSDVDASFARAPAAFQRQMRSQGVVPTGPQQADFQKQAALNKGIAEVGASNRTRAATGARNAGILGY